VAEFGQAVARACSSMREEVAEERGFTVSIRLAAKGRFGHPADRVTALGIVREIKAYASERIVGDSHVIAK
jgi:hypothetical protein